MKNFFLLMALLLTLPAGAQTVYESKGEHGRVFSDRPTTGARAVELKPLNVVEPVPVASETEPGRGERPTQGKRSGGTDARAAAADRGTDYRRFAIVFPEQGGTVAANNASFEVRLSSDPSLQIAQGHVFVLRLNGRPVPGRFAGTELMIPPETFDNVAPSGVQRQMLEAFIVDGSGRSIATATPVEFQMRFVTILQNPNLRPQPYGQPYVQPTPRPVPLPAPNRPQNSERPARETRSGATNQSGDR